MPPSFAGPEPSLPDGVREKEGNRIGGMEEGGMRAMRAIRKNRFGNEIPYMPGFTMAEGDEERVAVTLVCLFCLNEQEIHVPRSTVSHNRVLWECFTCQKRELPRLQDDRAGKD